MKACYLGMGAYQGAAPGLEVWPAAPAHCDPRIGADSLERTLALCEKAEALGFDWVSVAEHHYVPYMMTPNPAIMAGALSQRVKRAKIALLGPLVPLSNPVRLAEELAMIDALSGGRLIVLFLRGTPNEFGAYGTPPERTRSMTQEGIDLILKAWREDQPFAWHGENYNFDTVSVWPRVVQNPGPLVYGSGNSDESVAFAASRRIGIAFSFAPPEAIAYWVELYRREAAKHNWTPTPEHVIYRSIAYVTPSDEQANADTAAFFGAKAQEQARFHQETLGGPPVNDLIIARPYLLGSPPTVLNALDALREIGVGIVDMVFSIGDHEQQVAAMQVFAREVLPIIQKWDATRFQRPLSAA